MTLEYKLILLLCEINSTLRRQNQNIKSGVAFGTFSNIF